MATTQGDLSLLFFKKSIRVDAGSLTLDSDMIRVLFAVDEDKDMAQVAMETGMDPMMLRSVLSRLLDLGVIEPVAKTVRYMDRAFYDVLRRNLAVAVGPMSDFILEDILADMAISPGRIPVHRAVDLVRKTGEQIPDQNTRTRFEETMLRIIPA